MGVAGFSAVRMTSEPGDLRTAELTAAIGAQVWGAPSTVKVTYGDGDRVMDGWAHGYRVFKTDGKWRVTVSVYLQPEVSVMTSFADVPVEDVVRWTQY